MLKQNVNQQLISEIETNCPIPNDGIFEGLGEFKNYVKCLKDELFEEKENETKSEVIKSAESIFDGLDEIIKRNESSKQKAKETIEILNKMTDLFNEIVKNTDDEKKRLVEINNVKKLMINIKGVLELNEIKQIEKWTEMKFKNIIFDSNIDDWNVNTFVFDG